MRIDLGLTHPLGSSAVVSYVQLMYLVVGSDMSGFYDDMSIPSSYIFARNSELTEMPNTGSGLIDFKNGALKGPFNYPNAENTGCGGREDDNGDWRVEEAGCEYHGLHIYITGFSFNPPGDFVAAQIAIDFRITGLQDDEDTNTITFDDDPLLDGIDLGLDPTNIDAGEIARHVQFSMVFVGLREYEFGTYPSQSLHIDDFVFNAIHSDTELPITFDLGPPPDAGSDDLTIPHNDHYYATTADLTAHLFCGFFEIIIDDGTTGG